MLSDAIATGCGALIVDIEAEIPELVVAALRMMEAKRSAAAYGCRIQSSLPSAVTVGT
jgi:hypothetical protein